MLKKAIVKNENYKLGKTGMSYFIKKSAREKE